MNDETENPALEFKLLELKPSGFGESWFHGGTKIGGGEELENFLNRLGNEGWDVAHMLPLRIVLRRKAR